MANVNVNMLPDDGTWRTQAFRQNMVSKIEEAILHCGAPTSKNAAEMENQVFSKANSKNEYLSFVARLIIHIKDMGSKQKMGGPGGPPQNQPQGGPGQMGGPMGGGGPGGQQQNMGMMGQMNQINSINQMNQMGVNVMNPQGMQQQQQQQMVQGMQPGGMNMPQQQQQNPQQAMGMGQQGQMQQQPQPPNQMMIPNFMNQQAQMQQQQMQQQNPGGMNNQQGQMQQMPNTVMGTPGMQQQMQNQMGNPQMQQQMQQAMMQQQQQANQQQSQQMTNPQQQQMMQVRGMPNPQMVQGGRMMGPQSAMSNQLSQMAQQRKVAQHRPGGPNAMGIPRPEHGPNYAMNRVNYYGANMAQTDNAGMVNQYPGAPGGPPMQRPVGQFMPPTASQGMTMGPSPSPNSLNVSGPGVQNQPQFVNSPQSQSMMHGHGSPAGPGVNSIRSFTNQMIPSPNTNLNTPMPSAPTPSPRNAEDQACMEKIKELKKYTDLLQRMIAKIGNEDMEKSSKMKKLLEILTNPNQRVSMEILLKCEAALKKMERQQHDAGGVMGPASQPMPTKDQISPFQQIQDAILTALKNGSSSHTFLRTFRPTVEALTGQSSGGSESPDDSDCSFDGEPSSDIPWVLQRELKILDNRFHVTVNRSKDRPLPLQLSVSLADKKLPRVPPLKLEIPSDYPDESPSVNDLKKEYSSTPFLTSVAQALKSRLLYLPERFTVLELLNCWEMSVRQVSNPHPYRGSIGRRRVSGNRALAISFI